MKKECEHCDCVFEVVNNEEFLYIREATSEYVEIQIDCPNCYEAIAFARVKANDFIYLY